MMEKEVKKAGLSQGFGTERMLVSEHAPLNGYAT
jgi:hypothetical protein